MDVVASAAAPHPLGTVQILDPWPGPIPPGSCHSRSSFAAAPAVPKKILREIFCIFLLFLSCKAGHAARTQRQRSSPNMKRVPCSCVVKDAFHLAKLQFEAAFAIACVGFLPLLYP